MGKSLHDTVRVLFNLSSEINDARHMLYLYMGCYVASSPNMRESYTPKVPTDVEDGSEELLQSAL